MATKQKKDLTPRSTAVRFAEIIDELGRRLHIGCVMAAGLDWVEVSLPEHLQLRPNLSVRFHPSNHSHGVMQGWRGLDRVGLTYVAGGPSQDQFAGEPGLMDPRPAALKLRR